MNANILQMIAIYAIPVIFAITVHEAAHGYVARHFGDQTAYTLGRVSLNPTRHIDPIGTLLVPALTMFFGGIMFGWAKPVPIDYRQLKNPRRDMIYVAAAGPIANLVMALLWALLLKALGEFGYVSSWGWEVAKVGLSFNIILMVFNLLPIPPLDGSRVLMGLLPPKGAYRLSQIEPYGLIIVIGLLVLGVLPPIIYYLYEGVFRFIFKLIF